MSQQSFDLGVAEPIVAAPRLDPTPFSIKRSSCPTRWQDRTSRQVADGLRKTLAFAVRSHSGSTPATPDPRR
jgi:hypothetical protein